MKNTLLLLCIIFLGCLVNNNINAQPPKNNYQQDLNVFDSIKTSTPYLIISNKYHKESDYKSAILELEKGIQNSLIQKDTITLLCAYIKIESNYIKLGLFDQALDYCNKGLLLSEKIGSQAYIASFTNAIGIYFYTIGDIENAEKYYLKALNIREQHNDKIGLINSYNNVGVINKSYENYNKALTYYFKSLAIIESEKLDSSKHIIGLNNIGNVYKDLLEYDKAREYLRQAYQISLTVNSRYNQALTLHNIGTSYSHEKNYIKAIEYLQRSYEISKSIHTPKLMLASSSGIAEAYTIEGKHKEALIFVKKNFLLKQEILKQKLDKQFAFMQTKFESAEKDKKIVILENNTKIEELKRNILIIGIILLLSLGFVVINRQRKLIKKDKQLLSLEIKEKNRLEGELDFKTRELTNYALHIAQRNDFIKIIKSDILKISRTIDDIALSDKVKKMMVKLNQFANNNKDLEQFNKQLEDVNRHFIERLKKNFANLTEKELQLCILLRLRLSSKEIASITNITSKSVDMNRYRLRKKLNLNSEIDFYKFLQNI